MSLKVWQDGNKRWIICIFWVYKILILLSQQIFYLGEIVFVVMMNENYWKMRFFVCWLNKYIIKFFLNLSKFIKQSRSNSKLKFMFSGHTVIIFLKFESMLTFMWYFGVANIYSCSSKKHENIEFMKGAVVV